MSTPSKQRQLLLLALLVEKNAEESGIIYVSTRQSAVSIAEYLNKYLFSGEKRVGYYHGDLTSAERFATQKLFSVGKLKLLVATNAFGMGIDAPHIRTIIHFHYPGSLEAYYQEIGRAGRDGAPAQCFLLYNTADHEIHQALIRESTKNEISRQTEHLKEIEQYMETEMCRMQYLQRYYGETESSPCQNCDVCRQLPQLELEEIPWIGSETKKRLTALTRFRAQLAQKHALSSPFEVLSDGQLISLAVFKPTTRAELQMIPGFGMGWCKQWLEYFCGGDDKIRSYESILGSDHNDH